MPPPPGSDNPRPTDQALLGQALTSAANAVFITDPAGRILWVNPAFTRLSGYSFEDTIGSTPAILQSGEQNSSDYAKLWQTILSGNIWQGEMVEQRKDGSAYTVRETITPLFNDDGAITHFIAIQHDITAQKNAGVLEAHLPGLASPADLAARKSFLDTLQRAIFHANRTQHLIAILFLSLGDIGQAPDTARRPSTPLMSAVGERLRGMVRKEDVVTRIGEGDFAILLTDVMDMQVTANRADKLLEAVTRPFAVRGQTTSLSVSMGISIYPNDGEEAQALLDAAYQAMRQAALHEGNNFRFHHTVWPQVH